jgi:GntR family transcriptional regulator, rspAB operon transcriptional repressor
MVDPIAMLPHKGGSVMLSDPISVEETFPHLDHTDLTEQTYRILKQKILRRQLKPGQRILVDDIAHALGVSRTPVTDALKRLAVEGLVVIQPRRGTFVSELTSRDVAELFDIRLILELYAARHTLEQEKVDAFLTAIEEPMRHMREATVNDSYGDYETFIAADRKLHLELVKMTENQRLIQTYTDLNVHMGVSRAHYLNSVENAREAHQEHQEILRAFRSRDRNDVEQALATHILNVKTRILSMLEARGGKL